MSDWREKIHIFLGDITDEDCDVIVNAANEELRRGGGVCGAIHLAAGPGLAEECKTIGGCPPGEAVMTQAYELRCQKVIHAVGPIWGGGAGVEEDELLASCYLESLRLTASEGYKSIAFPSISTGTYGFPIERACRVALEAIKNGLAEDPELEEVRLVCFSIEDQAAYEQAFAEMQDE